MTPGMFIRLVLASGTFIKPVLTSGMFIRCELTSGMFIRSVMTPGMFTDLYWHQVYNKNAALYWVRQGIIQTSFHRTLWHLFCVSLIDPQPQFFFCRDKWPVVTDCFLCTPACSFFDYIIEEALQFIKCAPKECCSITLPVKGLFLHRKRDKASIDNMFLRLYGAIIHCTV